MGLIRIFSFILKLCLLILYHLAFLNGFKLVGLKRRVNLFFDNLNIHHIFASEEVESDGQNPTSNLGMGFYIVMKSKEAQIKNVCIENCNISMTGHTGIKIFGSGNSEGTSYLDSVTIINNKLENIGVP